MTRNLRAPRRALAGTAVSAFLIAALTMVGAAAAVDAQTPMVMRYTGRYEAQGGPDHMQDVAAISDDHVVVASSSALTIVDRQALDSGAVLDYVAKYTVRPGEPSNLDGAPPGDARYMPMFFHVESYPPYLYVSTRYNGLWIFRVDELNGTPRRITEVGRLMRPREFTEGIAILGDKLFLTHHADGVEVLDLAASPIDPPIVSSLNWKDSDAWSISAPGDDTVWVADGRGGVKQLALQNDQLMMLTGETRRSSPGMVFDLVPAGAWMVAAVGDKGVAVYERNTGRLQGTHVLPGVCVDIKPAGENRVVVACRSFVHALEVTAAGEIEVLASTRLHRQVVGTRQSEELSTHLGAGVRYSDGDVYIAGWDHLDAYELLGNDPQDLPDLEVTGQRAHFGGQPSTIVFDIVNTGEGTLRLEEPICEAMSLECVLGSNYLGPNEQTTLSIDYDGMAGGQIWEVDLLSNDPGDEQLRIVNVTPEGGRVDPGEPAPDFSGVMMQRDYANGTFVERNKSLSDSAARGKPVLFAIFGTWCPACLPAVASMSSDILSEMPRGADFFLVNPEGEHDVLRHVLEKIYIPMPILLDDDQTINLVYNQPRVGLPFGRSYVVDTRGIVTKVSVTYSPSKAVEALEAALP
jgi:peroxiredoxin